MKDAHPLLYWIYMISAVGSIGSGLNFIFLTPAFMPLSLDKWLVGLAFLGAGLAELAFLSLSSDHAWIRRAMASVVVACMFWVVALTYDFFARSLTSLQLPIFVLWVAAIGARVLLEPFINPATANGKHDK